jgi:hypothetical protein
MCRGWSVRVAVDQGGRQRVVNGRRLTESRHLAVVRLQVHVVVEVVLRRLVMVRIILWGGRKGRGCQVLHLCVMVCRCVMVMRVWVMRVHS